VEFGSLRVSRFLWKGCGPGAWLGKCCFGLSVSYRNRGQLLSPGSAWQARWPPILSSPRSYISKGPSAVRLDPCQDKTSHWYRHGGAVELRKKYNLGGWVVVTTL